LGRVKKRKTPKKDSEDKTCGPKEGNDFWVLWGGGLNPWLQKIKKNEIKNKPVGAWAGKRQKMQKVESKTFSDIRRGTH